MNREIFDSIDVIDQLRFVNGELEEGRSLTQIAKSLNMSRSTLGRRFHKIEHKFDKESNCYVNVHNVYKSTDVCTQSVQKSESKSTQRVQEKRVQSVQDEILKKIDDIHRILMEDKMEIKVEIMSSEYVSKTFRVEKNILNAFQELCKISNHSQQELISRALLDFINKNE